MGDIADWTNDTMQEAYPDWSPVGSSRRYVYGPPLRCKNCGEGGVYWQKVKGEYRLFNRADLEPHVCKTSADGFEDEPT